MSNADQNAISFILAQDRSTLTPDQRDAFWSYVFRAVRYPVAERVADKVSRNINFVVHTDRWLSPRSVY